MNNEKVNIQEIVELVATRLSVSKKIVEEFFRVILPVIEESLNAGEPVKLKGFGTLKLQWNKPRKSVNVNTGEEILLEGYNKIVFTPDDNLAELVNEPFAHLSPVVLDDSISDIPKENAPIKILNEQALEIKGILSELKNLKNISDQQKSNNDGLTETKNTEITEPEKSDTTEPVEASNVSSNDSEEATDITETPDSLHSTEEKIEFNNSAKENITTSPENSETNISKNEPFPAAKTHDGNKITEESLKKARAILSNKQSEYLSESKPQKISVLKWIFFVLFVFLAVFVLSYIFLPGFKKYFDTTFHISLISETRQPAKDIIEPNDKLIDSIVTDSPKAKEDLLYEKLLKETRNYEQLITIEQARKGIDLKYLSKKYYGSPIFWVYICEANLKEIKNPEKIEKGTVIKIPLIDSLLLDTTLNRTYEILEIITNDIKSQINRKDSSDVNVNNAEKRIVEKNQEKPASKEYPVLATERMEAGSRLTLFAKKYYGSKEFWVYIYEANTDLIKNPDNVPVGINIKIPHIDKKLIDPENPECITKAKELQKKYLKK